VKSDDGFVETYLLSDDTTVREDRDDAALSDIGRLGPDPGGCYERRLDSERSPGRT
jgi:hypothetical protein